MKKSIEIIVKGRVQGVGFRYYTYSLAIKYDIKGYVKNLLDGSVKIIAHGDSDNLKLFENHIKTGNSFSRVEQMIKSQIDIPQEYNSFEIKY